MRVPHVLRTRTRAVTADDFEYLSAQVDGVARARCITPNVSGASREAAFPGQIRTLDVQPGQVSMAVLPRIEVPVGRISPDQLVLSAELRASVQTHLDERRMVGTTLEVRSAQYSWVSVAALIRVLPGSSRELRADVQRAALAALYRYLNPHVGGASGVGWPFGRPLYLSELYSLLKTVPGGDFVEDVQVFLSDPGQPDSREPVGTQLLLPPQGLIVSDVHTVQVE